MEPSLFEATAKPRRCVTWTLLPAPLRPFFVVMMTTPFDAFEP
jgi:hypothetical protein